MLSLSMVVRNEEANLQACLESVKDLVDEMIVVDTGSTDKTISIAKNAGAKVHSISWPGDFVPARNLALQLVQGDWVLVLDADERLCYECIPELHELISKENILLINLLRYEVEAAMSPYSNMSRLFRKHPRIKWTRPYHSMVDDSIKEILEIEPQWHIINCSKPALIHYGYRPNLIKENNKPNRLRIAMEAWLKEHPGDPYTCSKLGGLEVSEGRIEVGIKLLNEGLKNQQIQKTNSSDHYELLLHLGIAQSKKDPNQAIRTYQAALQLQIDKRLSLGAQLNLANLLMQRGDLNEAFLLTSNVTRIAPEVAIGWYNLGLIMRKKGELYAAIQAYEASIKINPNHPESHQNYAVAQLLSGEIDRARKSFKKAINLLSAAGRTKDAESLNKQLYGMVNLEEI